MRSSHAFFEQGAVEPKIIRTAVNIAHAETGRPLRQGAAVIFQIDLYEIGDLFLIVNN